MGTLAITFTSIVLEAIPFVLLGSLLGGCIEAFVSQDQIARLLPARRGVGILLAAGLGLLIPACECAIIPITRRLVGKGVPFSVAVAYLIAGPIVNPIVAASTAVAYAGAWSVVALRLVGGYVIAVLVAALVDRVYPGHSALIAAAEPAASACGCHCEHETHAALRGWRAFVQRGGMALEQAADDFLQVSQFLILGAFAAALMQVLVPRQTFVALAGSPSAAILLMMLLAIVLNLCSEADAFVAASFRSSLPLTAQMAFLVLGPMLDLKLAAMYLSFVRKRAVLLTITAMCVLVFLFASVLGWLGWSRL
jgi:uncharacterized protein